MRSGGLILGFFLGISCAMAADADQCPNPMAGSIRAGSYEFQFQSWSWANQQSYIFCNCVRNTSTILPLFISWSDLIGFVKENGGISYVNVPASTDHQKKLKMPLWYGAGPQKVDVETLLPDEQSFLDQDGGFVSAIHKVADNGAIPVKSPQSTLTTAAAIYVPISNYAAGTKSSEIIEDVQKNPDILHRFEMKFISHVEKNPAGKIVSIIDECDYQFDNLNAVINNPSGIAIRFADEDLQRGVFNSSEPHDIIEDWQRAGVSRDNKLSFRSTKTGLNIVASQLTAQRTKMELTTSSGGIVLAAVPVVFYRDGK